MKPFTSFKVLTLASLIVYSGSGFAVGTDTGAGTSPSGVPNGMYFSPDQNKRVHFDACVQALNIKLRKIYISTTPKILDPASPPQIPPGVTYKTASLDPDSFQENATKVYPGFSDDYMACTQDNVPNTDGESCRKQESEIDDAVSALGKDCAHAPKVSSDAVGETDTAATADWAKSNKSTWALCIQDSYSCNQYEYGSDDSADDCANSSLDDLTKNGAKPEELKAYCQQKFPAQCGSLDRANLRASAKDMGSDLTAELKELTRDLAEKKKELADNKKQLDAADKLQQGFAAKALQDTKDLQTQYEAQVKASGAQIDAALETNYKAVLLAQQSVKTAAAGVTQADAVKFDAQNKFANACKTQAKAAADKGFPTGAVNYGGQNSLVTRNAKWQQLYTSTLQSLYADGTTCDGGAYANATLALLNSQKAQVQAEAGVQKAQSDLQLAMQKNTMKKDDASLDLLNKQRDKVAQLAAKQKQDYQDIATNEATLRKNAATMQEDINKIQAKIDNAPKKKACIQTIRSCSSVAGIPSGNASNAADIADATTALDKVISICKTAAKVCPGGTNKSLPTEQTSHDAFVSEFPTLGEPPPDTLFDTNKSACVNAIASKMEEKGPIDKVKARIKGAPKNVSDFAKPKK